jgi:chorismate-pyruvate lyase
MTEPGATPILDELVALFYPQPTDLGQFVEVTAEEMPAVYRTLLAHQNHMTVTVEQFHHSPVDVQVLDTLLTGQHYARKILLARQSDGGVVQFGIVRLNFAHVSEAVRQEIESQRTPVGRVLIKHNVHRDIHLMRLWKVTPGPDLRKLFGLTTAEPVYGRTAVIDFSGEPAVELIEIVTPVSD